MAALDTLHSSARRRVVLLELAAGAGTDARAGIAGNLNRARAADYSRAEYFAWSARRMPTPAGNDPYSGRPYASYREADRELGRAMDRAAATVLYARARRHASPFARMEARAAAVLDPAPREYPRRSVVVGGQTFFYSDYSERGRS